MLLKSLYLRHFRSYEEAEVSFEPGVNLIRGSNAQGKTNLLEAIYFLSTGRSFRTAHLSELIMQGKPAFFLEAEFFKDGVFQSIKISFDGQIKKMEYNSTSYSSFTPLLGLLPTVLYSPEDISLVMGSPAERRRFLNLHIAQLDPLYVHHLARYHRAMKQRNHLLKSQSDTAIGPWETAMAHSASYLVQKREQMILDLAPTLSEMMQVLSKSQDTLSLKYQSSFPASKKQEDPATYFLEQYKKNRKREMAIGSTIVGPHRDDFLFLIEQKEAKAFSSEGQKRSCIAAMRLSEWKRLHSQVSSAPLMSIDDFGVHLDASRQTILQELLKNLGQVFLTSPSLSEEILSIPAKQILIEKGKILQ
jgi:DNA replication and repair protein RecF